MRSPHQELQIVPGHSVAEKMHFIHPCPKRLDLVLWRAHTRAAHSAFNYPGAALSFRAPQWPTVAPATSYAPGSPPRRSTAAQTLNLSEG